MQKMNLDDSIPLDSGSTIDVLLVKLIDPVNFLVKLLPDSSRNFQRLEIAINDYYETYEMDKIPYYPVKGEFIVIKNEKTKSWQRAQVEAVVQSLHGYQVKAFLVDYGETHYVDTLRVRPICSNFKKFQFQALHLILPKLFPKGLRIHAGTEAENGLAIENGPVDNWTEATLIFIQKLIKDHTSLKAEIIQPLSSTKFDVKLHWYLPKVDKSLCLNEALVSFDFAIIIDIPEENDDFNNQYKLEIKRMKPTSNQLNLEWEKLQEKLKNIEVEEDYSCSDKETLDESENICGESEIVWQENSQNQESSTDRSSAFVQRDLFHVRTGNSKMSGLPTSRIGEKSSIEIKNLPIGRGKLFENMLRTPSYYERMRKYENDTLISLKKNFNNEEKLLKDPSDVTSEKSLEIRATNKNSEMREQVKKLPMGRGRKLCEYILKVSNEMEKSKHLSQKTCSSSANLEKDFSDEEREPSIVKKTVDSQELDQRIFNLPMRRNKVMEFEEKTFSKSVIHSSPLTSDHHYSDAEEIDNYDVAINDAKTAAEKFCQSNSYPIPVCETLPIQDIHSSTSLIPNSSLKEHSIKSSLDLINFYNELKKMKISNCLVNTNPKVEVTRKDTVLKDNLNKMNNETSALKQPHETREINPLLIQKKEEISTGNPQRRNSQLQSNSQDGNSSNRNPDILNSLYKHNMPNKYRHDFKHQRKSLENKTPLAKNNKEMRNCVFDMNPDLMHITSYHDVVVFGENPPKPVTSLNGAMLDMQMKNHLKELRFPGPSGLQSHLWPILLRGHHAAIIGPPKGGKTLGYLIPLISSLLQPSVYKEAPIVNGPLVLILCAQISTAMQIFETCKLLMSNSFSETIRIHVLDHQSNKLHFQVNLINGCEILIATPQRFLEILNWSDRKLLSLKRLSHLVLDNARFLIEQKASLILEIMKECCSVANKRRLFPWQIVLSAEQWTPKIASYVQRYMIDSFICVSSFLEAIVLTDLVLETHVCFSTVQDKKLQEILENYTSEKVIVCTSSNDKAKHLKQFIGQSTLTLLLHPDLDRFNLQDVCSEWESLHSGGLLIVVDESLPDVNITDGSVLIHYDLPQVSKTQFANRFRCILQRIKKNEPLISSCSQMEQDMPNIASHIIVTEKCGRQAQSLLDILDRLKNSRSPETLRALAYGNYKGKENTTVELCSKWKAFGICLKESFCKFRHSFRSSIDTPLVPTDSIVKVLVTHVAHASHYYVRLLEHTDVNKKVTDYKIHYFKLWSNLKKYYKSPENCMSVTKLSKTDVYAIQSNDNDFYRVKILQELPNDEVRVQFVDSGKTYAVKHSRLLKLPDELKTIPSHVVEVFLCDIMPVENGFDWLDRVNRFVHKMILGKELYGKVKLAVKSTLWLEPLVKQKYLEDLNTYIHEFNLRNELISQDYATEHSDHLKQLTKAFKGEFSKKNLPIKEKKIPKQYKRETLDKVVSLQYSHLLLNCNQDVQVTSVISPGLFYVQKLDLNKEFEELKNVTNEPTPDVVMEDIVIGNLYLVPFPPDNLLYRCCVEEINDGKITVLSIDFGDSTTVTKDKIYYLDEKYIQKFPANAIECSLYGIKSCKDAEWTESAGDALYNMVLDKEGFYKPLVLKVINISNQEKKNKSVFEVLLYDTNDTKDKLINKELVRMGLAESTKEVTSLEEDDPSVEIGESQDENLMNEHHDRNTKLEDIDKQKELEKTDKENEINHAEKKINLKSEKLCDSAEKICSIPADVQWYQTETDINLKIMVSCNEYELIVNDERIYFSAKGTKKYINEFDLYSKIVPTSKKDHTNGRYIIVNIKKLEPKKWPSLLKAKMFWLKPDFDHLNISDSDEEDVKDHSLPAVQTSELIHSYKDMYLRMSNKQDLSSYKSESEDEFDDDSNHEDDNL